MVIPTTAPPSVRWALAAGRALTATEPLALCEVLEFNRAVSELQLHGRDLAGKWIEGTFTGFHWFVRLGVSAGESQGQLPEGEMPAVALDVRGHRGLIDSFLEFVDAYERQVQIEGAFWSRVFGYDPGPEFEVRLFDPVVAGHLREIAACLDPVFNRRKVAEFRSWIPTVADVEPTTGAPIVLPQHLVAYSKHIVNLRQRFCVDGSIASAVPAACNICIVVSERAGSSEFERMREFFRLSRYLTADPEDEPVKLFNGIVKQALHDGFSSILVDIADDHRSRAAELTEEALDAETSDEHLNLVYEAIPRQQAALLIYKWLDGVPAELDQSLRPKVHGASAAADEVLVRLFNAIASQLFGETEFGRAYQREYLRSLTAREGPEAARASIDDEIERHWVYPRKELPVLLERYLGAAEMT